MDRYFEVLTGRGGAFGQVLWSVDKEGWCLWTGQKGGIIVIGDCVRFFTLQLIFIQEQNLFHCARAEPVPLLAVHFAGHRKNSLSHGTEEAGVHRVPWANTYKLKYTCLFCAQKCIGSSECGILGSVR